MKINSIITVLVAGSLLLAGCEEILEPSLEDKKVHLLGPANNLVTVDPTHSFFWDELKGATQYQLQVVTPSYAAPAYLVADTITTKLYFDMQLPAGQYQWRVRAKNSSTASQYSDTFNLVIQ